jgi:uncharacterized protein YicC (UPF0701 family)
VPVKGSQYWDLSIGTGKDVKMATRDYYDTAKKVATLFALMENANKVRIIKGEGCFSFQQTAEQSMLIQHGEDRIYGSLEDLCTHLIEYTEREGKKMLEEYEETLRQRMEELNTKISALKSVLFDVGYEKNKQRY